LALTGGAAAMAVLIVFLFWLGLRAFRAFTPPWKASPSTMLARLGVVILLFLLGASLLDYPLRTPLLSAVFAIAAGWLTAPRHAAETAAPAVAGSRRRRKPASWIARGLAGVLATLLLGWIALGVTASQVLGG